MATTAELMEALKRADAAGDTEAATAIANAIQAQSQQQQQQPPQESAQDYGLGNAVRHGLQQGATFGFADEVSAAGRAALDKMFGGEEYGGNFKDLYKMYRDDERQQLAGGREHHGGAMLAAEFIPGLLQGGAGATRAAGASTARQALDQVAQQGLRKILPRAAGVGAVYGAGAGLGYGEGEGLAGMAGDTAVGAAMGAGFGAGLPVVGAGVKRGVQNIGRRFQAVGTQGAAQEAAKRQILKDLRRDGLTPEEAARVIQRHDDAGMRGLTLGDVGPANGNLGDSIENIMQNPGSGRQRLEETYTNRQIQSVDRFRPALREGIEQSALTSEGLKIPKQYNQIEAAIADHANTLAKPLWKTAYLPNSEFKPTSWMKNLVRRDMDGNIINPQVRKADKQAIEQLRNRVLSGEITEAEARQNSRYFDELQRALKDTTTTSSVKGKTQRATTRGMVHDRLLTEMKRKGVMADDWSAARKLWAGKRANEEALAAGEKIFTGHVGKHESALSRMSVSERDHYLMGALRAIEDRIMRKADTGDLIRELRSTARGKEIIKLLFGGEKGFSKFKEVADVEARMAATYRRMQKGSATYGRGAKNSDVVEAGGTILGLMLNIPGLPWLTRLASRRGANMLQKADEMKRNEMAKLMLTRNPQQLTERLTPAPLPNNPIMQTISLGATTQNLPGLLDE